MALFTGALKITVCEATGLQPTATATRHNLSKTTPMIDPFVSIDVDEVHIDRTTTKQKTHRPVWNEPFTYEVRQGKMLGFTIFHCAAIPPDEFVANCSIQFEDLIPRDNADIWVSFHDNLSYN